MDGDAFAARDVADDFFAADGVATARAIDEQLVLAFDLERVRSLPMKRETAADCVEGFRAGLFGFGVG